MKIRNIIKMLCGVTLGLTGVIYAGVASAVLGFRFAGNQAALAMHPGLLLAVLVFGVIAGTVGICLALGRDY